MKASVIEVFSVLSVSELCVLCGKMVVDVLFTQGVAQAAVGLDGVGGRVDGAEFGPQGFDVCIHGAVEAGSRFLPRRGHELITREDAAGLSEEGPEQTEFVAGEI